jgi:hypothetical protein
MKVHLLMSKNATVSSPTLMWWKSAVNFLLPLLRSLPYASQRLLHPFLSPAPALLIRIPLGPCPLLHQLRADRSALFAGFTALTAESVPTFVHPDDLRHAAARLKALSHEAALRLRVPPPTTTGPRDDLDAAQRVAAILMDSHTPVLIAFLTTIGSHRSLAQNAPAKPMIRDQPRKWQTLTRYGLTRTGLAPVGLHQLSLAPSEIQGSRQVKEFVYPGNRTIRNMVMKHRRHHRDIRKYAYPKGKMIRQLTIHQLAAIGAIALAFKELEVAIDALLFEVIGQPHSAVLGISCIINMEDKITTINKGIAHFGLEPEYGKQIKEALDAFREFMVYRDAINHARIMSGLELESCGKAISDISRDDVLNAFYDHLVALEKEISSAAVLVKGISTLRSLPPHLSMKGLH